MQQADDIPIFGFSDEIVYGLLFLHHNILTRHVAMSIETMFCFFSLDCGWLCCCWHCGLEFSFPDTFGEMKSSSFSDKEWKLLIKC